jgi:hypothetical protein
MTGRLRKAAGLSLFGLVLGLCILLGFPAAKSVNDRNIYVLGDPCIADYMPRTAFSSNSQAKVAALMLPARLRARGGQDQGDRGLHLENGGKPRTAQAEARRESGLVRGHQRGHLRLSNSTNRQPHIATLSPGYGKRRLI